MIYYIKQNQLDDLTVNIPNTEEFYIQDQMWLDDFFQTDQWKNESSIKLPHDIELKNPQGQSHFDLENVKILFSALKNISISQATDERFWAYLSMYHFWNYMRKRWPFEKKTKLEQSKRVNFIRRRYFFTSNLDRALVRNGIARLWWYGYYSYDESYKDPYELTRILLQTLDITQSILERTFSRNKQITKAILEFLYEIEMNQEFSFTRIQFRNVMKSLNHIGGVTVLDWLPKEEIKRILHENSRIHFTPLENKELAHEVKS